MFKRKLAALGLPLAETFTPSGPPVINTHMCSLTSPGSMHTDQAAFRSLVVLLEDTKIRQYKLEDRTALRAVQDPAWESAFTKVCVHCVDLVRSLTCKR
jgi:hypothetical protein